MWYRVNVKSLTHTFPKKHRPSSVGTLVGTRFQPTLLVAIDEWRKQQSDLPTRPEAVRRLIDIGLRQTGGRAKTGLSVTSDLRGNQT